jgi:hypothetical protein
MLQMSDWLAELRNADDAGRRPADRPAEPVGSSGPRPEPSVAATSNWPISRIEIFAAEARARAQARADSHAGAPAGTMARPDGRGRAQITARAVIGDELRMPIMWCEMGSCISWYAHPAALGEADTRARAIDAGWRIDALGRLACPQCQQTDPGFWSARPVAVWDRYMAIARAARFISWRGDGTDGSAGPESGRGARRPASPAASPLEPGWHRQFPAAQTMPAVTAPNAPPAPPFARRGLERGPGLARLRGQPDGTRPAHGLRD